MNNKWAAVKSYNKKCFHEFLTARKPCVGLQASQTPCGVTCISSAMFKKCRRLLQSWPYSLGSKSKRSEFYIFLQKAEIFFVCFGADEDHCIKNKERETLEVKNVFIIAIPVFRSLSIERKSASAGNRTRVNCLEGSYAHHYTTDAIHEGKSKSSQYMIINFVHVPVYVAGK